MKRRGFLTVLLSLPVVAVLPLPKPKPVSAMASAFNLAATRSTEFTECFYPTVTISLEEAKRQYENVWTSPEAQAKWGSLKT